MNAELENSNCINFKFQWAVGDTRALEKQLVNLVRDKNQYSLITFFSRILSLMLVFLSSYILLAKIEFWKVILISLSATFSMWVSWGLILMAMRTLEKLSAQDSQTVEWNDVKVDRTGILWNNESTQEYVSWQGISEIDTSHGAIWFKTSPTTGYYIPPRIFESDAQHKKCINLIYGFQKIATLPLHKNENAENKILH